MLLSLHALLPSFSLLYFSWGGPECVGHVAYDVHVMEGAFWSLASLALYFLLRIPERIRRVAANVSAFEEAMHSKRTSLDVLLGLTHVVLLVYQVQNWSRYGSSM